MFKPKGPKSISRPVGARGKRAYAIGDIHGRHDLLEALLWAIRRDANDRPKLETHLVSLGDLIDRGPDSRQVVETFTHGLEGFASTNILMGNHEEMLVRGLTGEAHLLQSWLDHGGYACAESYGVSAGYLRGQPAEVQHDALNAAIPDSHVALMRGALESVRFGDYLFAHAGIRPGVPLDQQTARDMRWIRKEFLDSNAHLGCVVVHGHTVSDEVVERPNRIGLDTGAYRTGLLTAIMIEGHERVFLKAFDDGNKIRVSRERRPGLPD